MLKGTITEEELAVLKEAYPVQLMKYPVKLGKNIHDVIYRTIDTVLLEQIFKMMDKDEFSSKGLPLEVANQNIFEYCVLWPDPKEINLDTLPVGFLPSLIKSITEKSGFTDITINNQVIGPDVNSRVIQEFPYWGIPTEEELEKLRIKHPHFEMQQVRLNNKFCFIIRPLTRTDIHVANQASDRYIAIAKCVTLWPEVNDERLDWEKLPAGIISRLGTQAEEISGWQGDVEAEEV